MDNYTVRITLKRSKGLCIYDYQVLDSEGDLFYVGSVKNKTQLNRNDAEELVMGCVLDSLAADIEDNYVIEWNN